MNFKKLFSTIVSIWALNSNAQGLIHSGGNIVITDGAYVVIDGGNGNYEATGSAFISMWPNSRIKVTGNWINKGNTTLFTSNDGRIELTGGVQNIGGSKITHFPDLALIGTGTKTMTQSVLVGGGFNGGGTGILRLNSNTLQLNNNKLIINNRNPNAISYITTGGILSENSPGFGYGRVQWNLRDGSTGPVFTIPFINILSQRINFTATCNAVGIQNKDSGFISVATYNTADVPVPNNRPMPTGVFNTDNECDGENSARLIDRFWIIEDNGYAKTPDVTLTFGYANTDLLTTNNTINEANIGAIKYNSGVNKWIYPILGSVNTTNNEVVYKAGYNFSGIWTISDTTPYPKAAFTSVGNCEFDSILFTDKSGVLADKIVQWQWNFGNGKLSGTKNPFTSFTPAGLYNVRLVIRSMSGCQDTVNKNIQILSAPRANYTHEDTCENAIVKFESFSFPGSGMLKSETWIYGDGSPNGSGKKTNHYYGAMGVPTVHLIVYNSNGCKDTMSKSIFIAPKPYAYMSFTDDCQYTPITFTNGSTPGGGTISKYLWDFGNNRKSYNRNEITAYSTYGNFPVQMVVYNSFGCSDTAKQNITIYPRAIANFDYSPTELLATDPVSFNNLSQLDDNWSWEFGDGFFNTNEFVTHAYDIYGKYNVTLISSTQYGCADTITSEIYVKSSPLYWFPNTFTPGSTLGVNDGFGLRTPNQISKYHIMIYNLWGQILFESSDVNQTWDGTYNEDLCPIGAYVYHAKFLSPEGELQVYRGDVTIIR